MKKSGTKKLVTLALLLAICLMAQYFKSISQFITGPIVNTTLIIATLYVGLNGGLTISVLSPICAWLFSFAPIMQQVPQMVIVVALGNAAMVFFVWLFNKTNLIAGLAVGSVMKAALLWGLVSFLIIPFFGAALSDVQKTVVKAMFSYNQLITAIIGSIIAYFVNIKLKAGIK